MTHNALSKSILCFLFFIALTGCGQSTPNAENATSVTPASNNEKAIANSGAVNLYSARHYDNDLVLFEQFTQETGIKVNLIEGKGDALIERIANEGAASPADLFITADAGILWRAQSRDLFQPIDDQALLSGVPASFRHPEGLWIGLSKRARIIVYDKSAGLPAGLTSYEDLANPDYKNMICVRSSSNIYNQSLLASLIAHLGSNAAEQWAKGVVANFARNPQGNDTAQIKAVAAGQCRLGIVNSYYVARFVGPLEGEAKLIGDNIGVLFPNQGTDDASDRGTHVNISGAGIAKNAPNKKNAIKLLEFLLRANIQPSFAGGNNEYPVRDGVSASGPVTLLGQFKEDDLPVAVLGENQREAVEIFDRAGWQ